MMSKSEEIRTEEQLTAFLDRIDETLREVGYRRGIAEFNRLIGVSHDDLQKLNEESGVVLLNPKHRRIVDSWKAKVGPGRLKRRLEIFSRVFLGAQVDNDPELFKIANPLETAIMSFQPEVDGRKLNRSELGEILETDPDRSRRERAYLASKQLDHRIESGVIELFTKRNDLARRLEYRDYVDLGLELQDLSESDLKTLFYQVKELTQSAWDAYLDEIRSTFKIDRIQPWDISYHLKSVRPAPVHSRFPKSNLIDAFRRLLKKAGGDLDALPIQVIERDIPYGGLCMSIEFGKDIRILANPRDGLHWYDALFHEFGHGIHASLIDHSSYLVASGEPSFFWEGIAGIFERIIYERSFLVEEFQLTPVEIDQTIQNSKLHRINWFRSIAVNCMLEWSVYRNDPDPMRTYRGLVREFLGYEPPEGAHWAGNTLFTTHPLYSQNYLLMEVMALQTIEAYRSRFGAFPTSDLFRFVTENYVIPGAWISWREKIRNATGESLSAEALGRFLGC